MTFFWSKGALCARPDTDEERDFLNKFSDALESYLNSISPDSKPFLRTGRSNEDSVSSQD